MEWRSKKPTGRKSLLTKMNEYKKNKKQNDGNNDINDIDNNSDNNSDSDINDSNLNDSDSDINDSYIDINDSNINDSNINDSNINDSHNFISETIKNDVNLHLNKLTNNNIDNIIDKIVDLYKNNSNIKKILTNYIIENLFIKCLKHTTFIEINIKFIHKLTNVSIISKYVLHSINQYKLEYGKLLEYAYNNTQISEYSLIKVNNNI